jgi:hypothetical protein
MANPTSNYSFAMPTNTDLVKDLPADFDIFGQAVDDRIKALNPETTAGDISYRGGTANAKTRLGIGTAGQVLAVNAGATAPEWKTISTNPTTDSAAVATSESTTSTTFTDLTTSGPAVTVTTGTKALVIIGSEMYQSTVDRGIAMGFAVSGATTISASDADSIGIYNGENDQVAVKCSGAFVVTLTAGSNTFTAKYKRRGASGTAVFNDRKIFVMNLA